jgi:hypothetical protein
MWGRNDAASARRVPHEAQVARRAVVGEQASGVTRMVREPYVVGIA